MSNTRQGLLPKDMLRRGIDCNEIFSSVIKHVAIRILLTIIAQFDQELKQIDVKTVFLHGELKEKIYMK